MNHTPGPWYRKNGQLYSEVTKDEINHLVDDATYEANETLKAAAPSMFSAITNYLKAVDDGEITDQLDQLKAAIKKATEQL